MAWIGTGLASCACEHVHNCWCECMQCSAASNNADSLNDGIHMPTLVLLIGACKARVVLSLVQIWQHIPCTQSFAPKACKCQPSHLPSQPMQAWQQALALIRRHHCNPERCLMHVQLGCNIGDPMATLQPRIKAATLPLDIQ